MERQSYLKCTSSYIHAVQPYVPAPGNHYGKLTIFQSAFGLRAAAGGALGAMLAAMQKGVARGIFSNEAGLGSAPIAAAAVQTDEPANQESRNDISSCHKWHNYLCHIGNTLNSSN